jgi:hypothetical protein
MSFVNKFAPLIGIIFSLSALANEENALSTELPTTNDSFFSDLGDFTIVDNPSVIFYSDQLITNFQGSLSDLSPTLRELTCEGKEHSPEAQKLNSTNPVDFKFLWRNLHTANLEVHKGISNAHSLIRIIFNDIHFEDFPSLIRLFSYIRRLEINNCMIEGKYSANPMELSPELPSLEILTISDSKINDETMGIFSNAAPHLKEVTLNRNNISSAPFAAFIKKLLSIKELSIDLGGNKTISKDALTAIEGLPPSLTSLALKGAGLQNYITSFSFDKEKRKNLKTLVLTYNAFIGESFLRFVSSIPSLLEITHLDLQGNDLSPQSWEKVVKILREMPTLQTVEIGKSRKLTAKDKEHLLSLKGNLKTLNVSLL